MSNRNRVSWIPIHILCTRYETLYTRYEHIIIISLRGQQQAFQITGWTQPRRQQSHSPSFQCPTLEERGRGIRIVTQKSTHLMHIYTLTGTEALGTACPLKSLDVAGKGTLNRCPSSTPPIGTVTLKLCPFVSASNVYP